MKQLLMDQFLPGNCGFHVISVVDDCGAIFGAYKSSKETTQHFNTIRDWCKANCVGVWGYSTNDRPDYSKDRILLRRYFAFENEADKLMIALFMGVSEVTLKPVRPSVTKFMIFYEDDQ